MALRIGIVGLGVISKYYLAALDRLSEVELGAVCDVRPDALAPHVATVACHTDHRRMLDNEPLDAIVVTTPNDTHANLCRDALEAGLAVCVEKPLTLSLAEARALARLAVARRRPLYTAFHRRHNENVLALRDKVAGAKVTAVTVRYFERIEDHVGSDTWYLDAARCGGGCVADNGPNAFDLVRMFLGDVHVTEANVRRDGSGVDRYASVRLRAGRRTGHVLLDWSYAGERKDIEVRLASGAVLRADLLDGHPGFKNSLWHEYRGILTEFAETVAERRIDAVRPGLAALELVRATYRSEQIASTAGGN
ncbi:Gfo/Idh/MocA family protein [Amycolatopsis sp. CA-230715]|uniref:Gfo/Idh/MocA family protein n=1 Tax=Amycolatopsis sp. CA-230715 TaxID=2745196 RepID=UPI001C0276C8|nr:Inositol 2-dehydrogenase/D-chiro-inositol 3-dehydrogenase [Amycolatopsis sp. CA-230715]